jgi:tetratricopeptide (TPR) repeat protein
MTEMDPAARAQFEELHAAGMAAKDKGQHEEALGLFLYADDVADSAGDNRKRLDALNPVARALWNLERYEEAAERLVEAASIAKQLELIDEEAIAISNVGRLIAAKTIRTIPVDEQPGALREASVPLFMKSYDMLRDHPHLYYRYANASHGGVTAALAGERKFAWQLSEEGLGVAHRVSPEPYDQKTPAEINPMGLKQLKAAKYLVILGNRTPILAAKTRQSLVR